MPLAFDSISHGQIAFGFFNIDTDMLLLEHYFLFADQFCEHVSNMARAQDLQQYSDRWDIQAIQPPEKVGDLMGAIHGVRHTGFIGAVYRKFPFPPRPEDFKQKPDGGKNRAWIEALIGKYAALGEVAVACKHPAGDIQIGAYLFTLNTFQALIQYVWQGGYPRWKNEARPAYVVAMRQAMLSSPWPQFNTIKLF